MKITVQLFARARDLAGAERVELDLPASARIADVRQSNGVIHVVDKVLLPN